MLEKRGNGPATYYVPTLLALENWTGVLKSSGTGEKSQELRGKKQELESKSQELEGKKQELESKSQELEGKKQEQERDVRRNAGKLEDLPSEIAEQIEAQGKKGKQSEILDLVVKILEVKTLSASELARYLGRTPDYVRRTYLKPLLDSGRVQSSNPQNPTDPALTYAASPNRNDPQ